MINNGLFAGMRESYSKTAALSAEAASTLAAFCAYADAQLKEKNVVGVSYTPEGLALRFADGVTQLIEGAVTGPIGSVPVQVSGGTEKINARADFTVSPSFLITGK